MQHNYIQYNLSFTTLVNIPGKMWRLLCLSLLGLISVCFAASVRRAAVAASPYTRTQKYDQQVITRW